MNNTDEGSHTINNHTTLKQNRGPQAEDTSRGAVNDYYTQPSPSDARDAWMYMTVEVIQKVCAHIDHWTDNGHPAMGHEFSGDGTCRRCRIHFNDHQTEPETCARGPLARATIFFACKKCNTEFEKFKSDKRECCSDECSRLLASSRASATRRANQDARNPARRSGRFRKFGPRHRTHQSVGDGD